MKRIKAIISIVTIFLFYNISIASADDAKTAYLKLGQRIEHVEAFKYMDEVCDWPFFNVSEGEYIIWFCNLDQNSIFDFYVHEETSTIVLIKISFYEREKFNKAIECSSCVCDIGYIEEKILNVPFLVDMYICSCYIKNIIVIFLHSKQEIIWIYDY